MGERSRQLCSFRFDFRTCCFGGRKVEAVDALLQLRAVPAAGNARIVGVVRVAPELRDEPRRVRPRSQFRHERGHLAVVAEAFFQERERVVERLACLLCVFAERCHVLFVTCADRLEGFCAGSRALFLAFELVFAQFRNSQSLGSHGGIGCGLAREARLDILRFRIGPCADGLADGSAGDEICLVVSNDVTGDGDDAFCVKHVLEARIKCVEHQSYEGQSFVEAGLLSSCGDLGGGVSRQDVFNLVVATVLREKQVVLREAFGYFPILDELADKLHCDRSTLGFRDLNGARQVVPSARGDEGFARCRG